MTISNLKIRLKEILLPFSLSSLLFAYLIYQDYLNTLNHKSIDILIMTLFILLVLYTGYNIFKQVKAIQERKNGLVLLLVSSGIAVMFQVYFDLLKIDWTSLFYFFIYDFMYNLSFCVLFIVAFKFADLYFFQFYDQIKSR